MKDFREILQEQDILDESSGAMFAIKSLMDKFKKTPSEDEKKKIGQELKKHEETLSKSPYWKSATIYKDYQKFKQDNVLDI